MVIAVLEGAWRRYATANPSSRGRLHAAFSDAYAAELASADWPLMVACTPARARGWHPLPPGRRARRHGGRGGGWRRWRLAPLAAAAPMQQSHGLDHRLRQRRLSLRTARGRRRVAAARQSGTRRTYCSTPRAWGVCVPRGAPCACRATQKVQCARSAAPKARELLWLALSTGAAAQGMWAQKAALRRRLRRLLRRRPLLR